MKKPLTILAIESSCDETAAAVIIDGKIKSNIIASQAKLHAKFGGVVPEVAAREHIFAIIPTIKLALNEASTKLFDLDYIAVTQGPGLVTSLMVGVDTAKSLGVALNIPVIPINHMEAHIYANWQKPVGISNFQFSISKKIFPAIILIVSGGHTMLVHIKDHGVFKILGETLDDAAGEAFDKTAKMMGLGYPGGPMISKYAENGNAKAYNFPRPLISRDNFDFSFSGLKTSVLYTIQKIKKLDNKTKSDLSASLQTAIVETLIAKTEKAINKFKPKTIMLGGGVAANKLLREQFVLLAQKHKIKSSIPPFEFCTDNAGMIGLAAYFRLKHKKAKIPANFSVNPNLELKTS